MSTIDLIQEFLSCKRIAMVGVSSNQEEFSRTLMDEFIKRGYEISPVHPDADKIAGLDCSRTVAQIKEPPDAALVITPAEVSVSAIEDCNRAGLSLVWLYRAVGKGSVSGEALEICRQKNIRVIPGYCPFMFFPNTGLIHRFHRFFMNLRGTYPK